MSDKYFTRLVYSSAFFYFSKALTINFFSLEISFQCIGPILIYQNMLPLPFLRKQLPCHNDLEMKQHFLPPGVAHRSGSVSVVSNIGGQSWAQWALLEGKKLSTLSAIGGQNWAQWAILEDQDKAQWAISEGKIEHIERY